MTSKQLEELYRYKNRLMADLLTNESVVNLIDKDISLKDSKKLAYTRIFPYEYFPDTIEKGKTYLCFDVDIQESINKTYLLPTLFIWVFTHKDNLRLPEGGVRTDRLCSEITNVINGSFHYGLGELNLNSIKRFAPMTDFQGKVMTFGAKEFNRLYNHNKTLPNNRKRG